MTTIFPGRYTAEIEHDFVLFLIGMRINRPWQVRQWWPVAQSMPPMMETLYRHPEKGFLGGFSTLFWPGVLNVQYWRSFEDLERFAHSPQDPHLAAWKRFQQAVGNDGSVGIFHETYRVQAGEYESIYGNMPRFGLGSVFAHVPVVGRNHTARQRLRQTPATNDVVPRAANPVKPMQLHEGASND
jgi:hypothetical protein